MEIQHFFHEHPLFLSDERHNPKDINCKFCTDTIEGLTYSCKQCPFALHKWCAELPQEKEYPYMQNLKFSTTSGDMDCGSCSGSFPFKPKYVGEFGGTEVAFHMDCAYLGIFTISQININGFGCDWKIVPDVYQSPINCTVCGLHSRGSFLKGDMHMGEDKYFDIRCALLSGESTHPSHPHTLYLAMPENIDHEEFEFDFDKLWSACVICDQAIDKRNVIYMCPECKLGAHISCVSTDLRPPVDLIASNPVYN